MAERNNYAQKKYRDASSSQNKDDQHVSHTYPIELANHIQSKTTGPPSSSLSDAINVLTKISGWSAPRRIK